MRRYRGKNLQVDWGGDEYFGSLAERIDGVTDEVADMALSMAKSLSKVQGVGQKNYVTGKLSSEIEIKKSKFKAGGRAVTAQGPDNYTKFYASFIELGHFSSMYGKYDRHDSKEGRTYVPAKPFLRPAVKAARRMLPYKIKKVIEGA
jgi:hypothetical protein